MKNCTLMDVNEQQLKILTLIQAMYLRKEFKNCFKELLDVRQTGLNNFNTLFFRLSFIQKSVYSFIERII